MILAPTVDLMNCALWSGPPPASTAACRRTRCALPACGSPVGQVGIRVGFDDGEGVFAATATRRLRADAELLFYYGDACKEVTTRTTSLAVFVSTPLSNVRPKMSSFNVLSTPIPRRFSPHFRTFPWQIVALSIFRLKVPSGNAVRTTC